MKKKKNDIINGQAPKETNERVTIVGGRPMHRAVAAGDLPMGIEQSLTLAALDYNFRSRFLKDPVKTAKDKGIQLDEVEKKLLTSTNKKTLADMVNRTISAPKKAFSRRRFMKNVAASVALLVGGKAFMLCSGCTGADSWEGPDPDGGEFESPIQKWADFAGYTCYVYIPAKVRQQGGSNSPLLVALSDDDETCLSSVQRWRDAADSYGIALLAVNWTQEPMSQEEQDKLADDLSAIIDEYGSEYDYDSSRCHVCSRGASTSIVFRGCFERHSGKWASVLFLGGHPGVNCADYEEGNPPPFDMVEMVPALYYVIGLDDPDYDEALACHDMLSFLNVDTELEEVEGTSDTAVLTFSTIWEWMDNHTA